MIQAGVLHVKNTIIRNVTNNGIDFVPTGAGELYVTDSYISETGGSGAATTAAISIIPTGVGAAKVLVEKGWLPHWF